jgi:putative membrane protein
MRTIKVKPNLAFNASMVQEKMFSLRTAAITFSLVMAAMVISSCHSRSGSGTGDSTSTNNTGLATPQTGMGATDSSTNNNKDKNLDFVKEAAYGGLMEVELGKYAQKNAQNKRVRNFGAMMVKDHSKANDELKSLAQKKNYDIPNTLDDKHLKMVNDIQEKRGADFDKEYMNQMVDDHEKDVDQFKKFAENNNDKIDADLKSFASKTLPVLLMHEDSAKNIKNAVK